MIVLTHCYPTAKDPISGIWLHRAFSELPQTKKVKKISKWGFLNPYNYLCDDVWDQTELYIACWVVPAGFICWVCGNKYVLYCIGLDCFWIEQHRWFAWLCLPIFNGAQTVVYASERVRKCINSAYNNKYDGQVINLPVSAKEFYPKETL